MRGWVWLIVLVAILSANEASAWPRNQKVTRYSSPQAACEAKVAMMAARGIMAHLGGGYGGGSAEGIGSGKTAAQASANCCFSGQLPCLGSATAFGHGSWFACKIYAEGPQTRMRTRTILRR